MTRCKPGKWMCHVSMPPWRGSYKPKKNIAQIAGPTEDNQQHSVEGWPGQLDQNNSQDQHSSVDFVLARPQYF